jgi:hypothetical protein
MSEQLPQVDRETRARFAADGVVCLRGILPPSSVAALCQAVDNIASRHGTDEFSGTYAYADIKAFEMTEAVPAGSDADGTLAEEQTQLAVKPGTGTAAPMDYWPAVWRRNIIVRVIALDSVLPQIVASILDATKVNFCGDRISIREPHAESAARFIRNENFLPVGNGAGCSVWICLDSTPETDSLAFVRGSHLWPDRAGIKANARGNVEGETLLRFATAPGDLVIYNLRTYWAAGGNGSTARRRALMLHYCNEDMRFRRRPGIPAIALNPALKDGGSLDSPDYPVVWPRPYPGFAIATLYENAAPAAESSRRGRK